MNDTSEQVRLEIEKRFQSLTPEERFMRGIALIDAGWEMARYAVRLRFKPQTDQEFRRALLQWMYGGLDIDR